MKKMLLVLLMVVCLPIMGNAQEWELYQDTYVKTNISHEYMQVVPPGILQVKRERVLLVGSAFTAIYDLAVGIPDQFPIYFDIILQGHDREGTQYYLVCRTSIDGDQFSDFGQVFSYNPFKLTSESFHANAYCEFVDGTHGILLGTGFGEFRGVRNEKKDVIKASLRYTGGMDGSIFSGVASLGLVPTIP
jgi:hypothetical protein